MKLIFALLAALLLSSCTTPPKTKAELRSFPIGEPQIIAGEFHALAKKWDEQARKLSVDFIPSTSLVFDEARRTAEITVQGQTGPYALIELTAVDAHTTKIAAFGWDKGANKTVVEWLVLIKSSP